MDYYHRYRKRIEKEKVWKEGTLRWLYGDSCIAKSVLSVFVKRLIFSYLCGIGMRTRRSARKIVGFIREYDVDSTEFEKRPEEFYSFQDFFCRKLKKTARPIASEGVIFPSDGRHMGFQKVDEKSCFWVKGQRFELETLLGDPSLAKRYQEGTLVLSRLCPADYHRFHFPISGIPGKSRLISGPLFSVHPIALRAYAQALFQNKRMVTIVETESWGSVVLVEVGATCVGSIRQTYTPGRFYAKGSEKGFFSMGSSLVTLFEPGRVLLAEDLRVKTAEGYELYAHMGDGMGESVMKL